MGIFFAAESAPTEEQRSHIGALVEMSENPHQDIQQNLFTFHDEDLYNAFFENWGLTPVALNEVLRMASAATSKSPRAKL